KLVVMERRGKLYGALSQSQMEEAQMEAAEEHAYQEEDLGEQEMDDGEYFEYVQWDGDAEEEIAEEAPTGHVMMGTEQQQGEEYAEDDFSEYVEFNDEEDAKRYIAKMHGGDMIGGGELVDTEEGPNDEHLLHQDEMHDPTRNLFQMYAAPTTRRQATVIDCEICGVALRHPSKIEAHMRTHTGERPFECSVCGRRFTQRTPWRMHEKRHAQDLQFLCSYGCGKAFPNASQRNAHDLRHAGRKRMGPPRPHLKPKKTKIVQHRDEMEEIHQAMMDDMRGPPIIEAPLFEEPIPLSAAAHKRLDEVISAVAENRPVRQVPPKAPDSDSSARRPRHRRAPPIVAQCQICGLMVKHPSKIQAHMRSHNGVKPWQCTVCGLSVATLYALRMHHRRKHVEGDRPLSCTWECGRRFVSVSARNEHERIVHAGIKRYECSIGGCRRLFTRRSHLVAHRLRDHPGLIHVDEFDDAVDLHYELPGMPVDEEGVLSHLEEGEVVEEAVDGHVMEEGEEGREMREIEEEEGIMGDHLYQNQLHPPQLEEECETPPPSNLPLSRPSTSRPPTMQFQRVTSSSLNSSLQLPASQPVVPRIMKIARIVRRPNTGM
ncbi:hypothetical protein PFISCL1PPCAC_19356, partial [Pristionchus fissidentatus]